MSLAALLKDLRYSLFYRMVTTRRRGLQTLGGQWTWTIDPAGLGPASVAYCAGAGDDISFELDLVRRFGCRALVLDPSPPGALTMSKPENAHPLIDFEPIGLSDRDASFTFDVPENRTGDSYTLSESKAQKSAAGGEKTSFDCECLPTIMKRHGHDHIDLLKMDIEGFEYGVLRQIIDQQIPVRQICVEFHHFMLPQFSNRDTTDTILDLRRVGLRLVHHVNWDHTFVLN